MKKQPDHIKDLAQTCSALIEQEGRAALELVNALVESVAALQGDSADRRLQRLTERLRGLRERITLLAEMARRDFLDKIAREAEDLQGEALDGRAGTVVDALVALQPPSLSYFCETLLDRLIEVTGAERGFILYYLPQTTEADIIAARNYGTTNLSLREHDLSRSLLREVFRRGGSLLVEDAARHSAFGAEASVRELNIRSVLAAPLVDGRRTVGALYLENNTLPGAFGADDRPVLEAVARFVIFYLRHARLLPAVFEEETRVFFDAERATKEIVGRDPKVVELVDVIGRIADSPAIVLIEGESGTGKELVARALHYQSARRERPFVAVNCAAIPDNLLESELFGHEKGAFTGATERHVGLVEQADGGTLFLDEVSELPYQLQAKLLRFLQSNEFHRLGAKELTRVDVRVVAATSKDLGALTAAGQFQKALYYRLNVIPVRMPALRERREDVPLLVGHFLEKFSTLYGKNIVIEREVYEALKDYPFPGNVRELENLVHRLIALARGDVIRMGDLPEEVFRPPAARVSLEQDSLYTVLETSPADLAELQRRRERLRRLLAEQERQLAERVVRETGGNVTEAANRLGIHRITLHKMLRKTGEQRDEPGAV